MLNLRAVLDGCFCRRPEGREGHGHLYCDRIHMMLKRLLFSRGSFFGREEGGVAGWFVNVLNVAGGWQKFRHSDKNGGMKSHDHKVQWVSKAAAKAAENSVQCPGT